VSATPPNDKSLQFLYWLNKAKQFNEQHRGEPMNSFDETIKSLTDQAQQLGAWKEQLRIIKLFPSSEEPWTQAEIIALINGDK
jgi:hypothetical protein